MAHVVERMRTEDVDSVVAIDRGSPGSSAWNPSQLREELARSWAHLWVVRPRPAEVTAPPPEPLAFLATWLVQDELHILNIATHVGHRRRGHGRALLHHALGFAREHAVRLVLLEVRRSNSAAIELYRKLGFVAMGLRARYYGDEEDAVEMLLRLDPVTGEVIPGRDEVRLS
jgi:ribosomal-protein-alanine N-acetyltransferase